ncbi:S-adenosyl-L-methionine-dependent methyltransferase [Lojkania enalia]|uniref:S-adenosyl-L-methionine-dependent methyltransferase n=1 Tax=Lojkania enalia TaxID=147567 RepID=A0A9P4N584_9PLEO|nr:S-adenosyl-L-methionine-dependent methyltransferase [Didymosphaeria enalia]
MVYYPRLVDIRTAFQHIIGKAAVIYSVFRSDNENALRMASLRPGDNVLELGCGSGNLIAAAKRAVGCGVCVAVDGVPGLLDVDLSATLRQLNLTKDATGPPNQRISAICANITDGALQQTIANRVGDGVRFDVIFALHVFNTIPPDARRAALQMWKRLLAPGGRIVLSMSGRYGDALGQVVQFSNGQLTESPGCVIILCNNAADPILTANGSQVARRTVKAAVKFSSNYLWTLARNQAIAAASEVNLRATDIQNIGDGLGFHLSHTLSSPPPSTVESMSASSIDRWLDSHRNIVGYQCRARILEANCQKSTPGWTTISATARETKLALSLQEEAAEMEKQVNGLTQGSMVLTAEHQQVGVLVVLQV